MPHIPTFRKPFLPQKLPQTKNATRHESRLNALLCSLPFSFNLTTQEKLNKQRILPQPNHMKWFTKLGRQNGQRL